MKKLNYIALVVDQSGSMAEVKNSAEQMVASLFQGFADVPADQETFVSYYPFNNVITYDKFSLVPAAKTQVPPYRATGGTSLYNTVDQVIRDFENVPGARNPDTAFKILVVTDGEDTTSDSISPRVTSSQLARLIKSSQREGNWTFVVHCPPGKDNFIIHDLGIPSGNVRAWTPTDEGMRQVRESSRVGTQAFYSARTKGARGVSNYLDPSEGTEKVG